MNVQMGLGQQPFELAVLARELTQPPGVRDIHAAESGPPLVEGGVAEIALWHSSLIGMPVSACLMNPMICSSVNLLFLMSVILLVDGLPGIYVGTAGGGQVTESTGTFTGIRSSEGAGQSERQRAASPLCLRSRNMSLLISATDQY